MYFNSYDFILLFLPVVLLCYFLLVRLNNKRIANLFLLLASVYFYSQFNLSILIIIFISITVNYFLSSQIFVSKKRWMLYIGVLFNIGLLAYFKYMNFFIENINIIMHMDFTLLKLIVPIGISFFTFQQISYIIDSYKSNNYQSPFLEYALHILFFGYIISGPIVRHNQIIPQFMDDTKKNFNHENFAKGLMSFILGLAKKVLIADTFAIAVAYGYENVYAMNTTSTIFIALGYTLQIYFDFSGYSDMVTGIGKMLNLDIPINFNSPYKAITIMDFWKRWHITLTKFFTDYIYIPLGGNRRGKYITYFNVFIVFFISGIWHGANWTFIIWGIMHGTACIIERIFKSKVKSINPILLWIITFTFINIAWIFFRANSVSDAMFLVKTLISLQFGGLPDGIVSAFMLPELKFFISFFHITSSFIPNIIMGLFYMIALLLVLQAKNTNERIESFKPTVSKAIFLAVLAVWCMVSFSTVTTFIYVNF